MNRLIVIAAFLILSALPSLILAETFEARLSGFNEVHFEAGNPTVTPVVPPALRGAISTGASGKFRADLDEANQIIKYELSFENLRAPVTQGHIHFGQRHTVGGIIVWLCQTSTNMAPITVRDITPDCPSDGTPPGTEGTVTGEITPANLLPQAAQGFEGQFGDFNALVRAIRNGAAYANVHTMLFTPGEIRGHIRASHRDPRP
jgi:hypothetical protein